MYAINFDSISHSYTKVSVLSNITADISENQITVILGKSGSGKSTLLQMVNGLILPKSGTVSIYDQLIDYAQLSRLRLGIGYSVQGISLFPHLTVHDNIALLPKINQYDKTQTEERINYLMK